MLGDNKFLGMIGPTTSAVAKAEIPAAAPSHFVMISPSNTNPCLTKDLPDCSYHPQDRRKGTANNYFPVVTTHDYQGPAMSSYAYTTLKSTKIAVLDDSTVVRVGVANTLDGNVN